MKFLISLTILFSFSMGMAEEHEQGHEGQKTEHTDWNKIFKQPESDASKATPPKASKILAPEFLSKVKGTEVTLKWAPVEGAQYHLQVAKDPNFKWLLVNNPLVTYTEFQLTNLEAGHQYFWRVYTQIPTNTASYTKGPAVKSEFEAVQ